MKIINTLYFTCYKIAQGYRDKSYQNDLEEMNQEQDSVNFPEITQDNVNEILEDQFDENEDQFSFLGEKTEVPKIDQEAIIQQPKETLNTIFNI